MGLRQSNTWHLHARIHHQTAKKVQAQLSGLPTALPAHSNSKTKWEQITMTAPTQHFSTPFKRRYTTCSTSYWQHPLLCPRGVPHMPHGSQYHFQWASIGDRKHHAQNQATPWLLGNAFGCNGPVLRIGHGYEHPLGCVIFIGGQRTQQGVWPFLHGMEA